LKRKNIRRDQRIGLRLPWLVIGRSIIGNDQIKVEHKPVELLLPKATAVKQDGPAGGAVPRGDRFGHGGDARVYRLAELRFDKVAEGLNHSFASGGDAYERKWLRRAQQDWFADASAESFTVKDHLARLTLDRNLVGFLDMNPVEFGAA